MEIWFYLFLIIVVFFVISIIKIMIMKQEMKNINHSLTNILKMDTNTIITMSTNDKDLKQLVCILNQKLKEIRQLKLEYQNGNRELKSSITNISHDLRTPLTAIRGYLELMDEQNLSNQQLEYFKIIDKKTTDLIELTEQLFDFTKMLDTNTDIKKETICINDILEDTIASFYGLLKEHNITPKIELCEEKVIRLQNEMVVKRIFENIISNAIKYSEEDFRIKMYSNGIIQFSNKTNKIDKVSMEKLFDRYYTVRNAKKATGIGLSIAKQLVELSGGKMEAKYDNSYFMIEIQL